MQVEIRLTHTNPPYAIKMAREALRAMKGSLFAEALETDPEATEISLDNPVVEPKHLNMLSRMTHREEIKVELPTDFNPEFHFYSSDAYEAAKYLNWPLLDVIMSGLLNEIHAFAPYANIHQPETYGPLLLWSLSRDYTSLTQHILQVTQSCPLDAQAFIIGTISGRLAAVKVLLSREVNPATAYTPLHILKIWYPQVKDSPRHMETLLLMESKQNQALCLAVAEYLNFPETSKELLWPLIQLLLQEERCHSSLPDILRVACQVGSFDLIEMMLTLTPVDPNITVEHVGYESVNHLPLIVYALEELWFPLAKFLVTCPRLKLSDTLRQAILHLECPVFEDVSQEIYEQLMVKVREEIGQN